jgi:hypothetical protein
MGIRSHLLKEPRCFFGIDDVVCSGVGGCICQVTTNPQASHMTVFMGWKAATFWEAAAQIRQKRERVCFVCMFKFRHLDPSPS